MVIFSGAAKANQNIATFRVAIATTFVSPAHFKIVTWQVIATFGNTGGVGVVLLSKPNVTSFMVS